MAYPAQQLIESNFPIAALMPHFEPGIEAAIDSAGSCDFGVLITARSAARTIAIASAIHARSAWRHRPFIVVSCAGLTASRLVGLPRSYPASGPGGTLLLQDVDLMSAEVQSALVSRLSDPSISRSGRPRLIASTSERLIDRVAEGRFDDRLFYRLNCIHIVVARSADVD